MPDNPVLLVPLDGSPLAESAVHESWPLWSGVSPRVVVERGNAAETIVDFAKSHHVDRIVMATHGRSGLTRWMFGSVAEKVLHAADCTVVLVPATAAT